MGDAKGRTPVIYAVQPAMLSRAGRIIGHLCWPATVQTAAAGPTSPSFWPMGGESSNREGVLFRSVQSKGRKFSSFFHRFTPNKT